MSKITIVDLEVFYSVGVTEEERAKPQRLLLTIDFNIDFSSAAVSDRLERTINYQEVVETLTEFGKNRQWRLLEKLVTNIAESLMVQFRPQSVMVLAKKFPFPNTRYVSVSVTRSRPE